MKKIVLSLLFIQIIVTAGEFVDPAPPEVAKLEDVKPPEAKPADEVKVFGKPKPLPAGAVTNDWVSFLGPTHNCMSSETKLLKKLPENGPALLWELPIGTGYSSPAVLGERLVYIHRLGDEELVECLHPENGARYWQFKYKTEYADRYGYNNGPRCSPVIDGDRVYTYGAEGKLHCLKLTTGQVFWKRDIVSEFKVKQNFFGVGSTPLIDGNLLIVNVGAPGGPCVAAFDKLTGKMVWGAGDQWGASYASPIPAEIQGKHRVLVFAGGESRPASGGLLCIDPANGKVDFTFPWRSKTVESVNASSPVVIGNQVFVSATYDTGGTLLTIKPDFTHEVAWQTPNFGTHWMTSVHKDGYLYGFEGRHSQNCQLVCFEVATGKEMWRETLTWQETVEGNGQKRQVNVGAARASLLWVDGQFLCLGEMGHLMWMDLTPQGCKVLSRAWLFAAPDTWALPVLSRGLLYINQHQKNVLNNEAPRLRCYDFRAAE
jgi:outer membrane protein assembly factor BamB